MALQYSARIIGDHVERTVNVTADNFDEAYLKVKELIAAEGYVDEGSVDIHYIELTGQ